MPTNLRGRIRTSNVRAIASAQHLMVLLACAASLASSQLLLPAAALIVLVWLGRWLLSRKAVAATPADLGILLLMGMAGVSLFISPLPEVSRLVVLRLFIGVATYYAVAEAVALYLPSPTNPSPDASARVAWLLFGLALIGTALACLAPISVDWYANKGLIPPQVYSRFIVVFSDSVHPNVMAGSLVLFLPFSLTLLLFYGSHLRRPLRLLALLTAGIMLIILVLTQSRSSYIACAAATLCLALLRLSLSRPQTARALALVGIGLVLAGLVLQFSPVSLGGATISPSVEATIAGRMEIWSRGIYMVQDFPFTGIGMGLYPKLIETLYPYFINPVPLQHAHNLLLQVAVDLGLPGLVAWLSILLVTFSSAVALYRHSRQSQPLHSSPPNMPWQTGLSAGLIASQLALMVGGLTDAVTWGGIRTAPLIWIIWGVAVGSWMHAQADQDTGTHEAA